MNNLGSLERAIMEVLWDSTRPMLVRELQGALNADADKLLAYTTVQTVAERLVKKGLLSRTPERKAFRYAASHSRDEHVTAVMLEALAESPDRAPVLSRFAQSVDIDDALRLLEELARRTGEQRHVAGGPGWVPPPA
ncbi:BlaI/MecI/CopY family transcriptional regulator [Sphaerisporangium sp. TRM90804]|uniref:BlaI/MecI/CopY family transcriptional regulator n=1 Tax=Sphaerisporangium sp. TRM90804 TaxID=3031113 RepID=UPI002448B6FD|nr:BlaI/MecI/CopY family transcriptional regulator [Sphaerisporangium sp. TRM90804]MDH2427049.1 BlaI/MecI/CopY family transcriptional regulator [Sphaerisporangium sp. TRM90804]